jgi:D-ribose pyranase
MKKNGILNSEISSVLSDLGHTDKIVIADCGLPIPEEVMKIDIALKFGIPSFIDTLEEILKDMKVDSVTLAEEIKIKNPDLYQRVIKMLDSYQIYKVKFVSHEDFKAQVGETRAVIRTGEATPYANIILEAGVIF